MFLSDKADDRVKEEFIVIFLTYRYTLEYWITVQMYAHVFFANYSPSVQQHQIVLLCKPYEMKFSIMYVFIDAVRLSGTLEYKVCHPICRLNRKLKVDIKWEIIDQVLRGGEEARMSPPHFLFCLFSPFRLPVENWHFDFNDVGKIIIHFYNCFDHT